MDLPTPSPDATPLAQTIGQSLRRQYSASVVLVGILLLSAFLAEAWFSLEHQRADRRAAVQAQSEQLKLSLEDDIHLVRGHVFAMRRAIENSLARLDQADDELADRLLAGIGAEVAEVGEDAGSVHLDIGTLFVTPGTVIDGAFRRDLAAASAFLAQAAGNHQWYRMFEWSYLLRCG